MPKSRGNIIVAVAIIFSALIIAAALIFARGGDADKSAAAGASLGKGGGQTPQADPLAPIIGEVGAPVVMDIYLDYQCHYCKIFAQTIEPPLKEKYVNSGKVKMVFRDFPFLSEESKFAAQAGRCANDQGKFMPYVEKLHLIQGGHDETVFGRDNLKNIASKLGLDAARFNECFDSGKYIKAVDQSYAAAQKIGIDGTPTVFINGQKIDGVQDLNVYEGAIEAALNK